MNSTMPCELLHPFVLPIPMRPRFIHTSILTHCQHVQDLQQNMPRKLAAASSKSFFLSGKEWQRNVHRVDLQMSHFNSVQIICGLRSFGLILDL